MAAHLQLLWSTVFPKQREQCINSIQFLPSKDATKLYMVAGGTEGRLLVGCADAATVEAERGYVIQALDAWYGKAPSPFLESMRPDTRVPLLELAVVSAGCAMPASPIASSVPSTTPTASLDGIPRALAADPVVSVVGVVRLASGVDLFLRVDGDPLRLHPITSLDASDGHPLTVQLRSRGPVTVSVGSVAMKRAPVLDHVLDGGGKRRKGKDSVQETEMSVMVEEQTTEQRFRCMWALDIFIGTVNKKVFCYSIQLEFELKSDASTWEAEQSSMMEVEPVNAALRYSVIPGLVDPPLTGSRVLIGHVDCVRCGCLLDFEALSLMPPPIAPLQALAQDQQLNSVFVPHFLTGADDGGVRLFSAGEEAAVRMDSNPRPLAPLSTHEQLHDHDVLCLAACWCPRLTSHPLLCAAFSLELEATARGTKKQRRERVAGIDDGWLMASGGKDGVLSVLQVTDFKKAVAQHQFARTVVRCLDMVSLPHPSSSTQPGVPPLGAIAAVFVGLSNGQVVLVWVVPPVTHSKEEVSVFKDDVTPSKKRREQAKRAQQRKEAEAGAGLDTDWRLLPQVLPCAPVSHVPVRAVRVWPFPSGGVVVSTANEAGEWHLWHMAWPGL